jgi:hypothetical protein
LLNIHVEYLHISDQEMVQNEFVYLDLTLEITNETMTKKKISRYHEKKGYKLENHAVELFDSY